jgi:competence protein ComEC
MRLVAALPACALVSGAALGLSLSDTHRSLGSTLIAIGLVVACSGWRLGAPRVLAAGAAAVFFIGGALIGASAWQRAWRPPLRVAFEAAADEHGDASFIVEGTLRADASPTASGVSLSVDVDRAQRNGFRASGGVILTVVGTIARDRIDDWRAGRRIRASATLRRPSRYLDPGVADNERALARRGTTLVGTVKSGALVEVIARGNAIVEALAAARAYARLAIAEAVGRWDTQAAAIVEAIVIGDRAGLEPPVQRRLQEAGTYHVIAISGGNIAILAGLLLAGFRFAGWLGAGAYVIAIVVLVAYAALVGGGASVDRATLMATLYFAGRACDQRSPPLNTLAVTAALLVAADPLSVADPAAVLTFGATLAILVASPTITTLHAELAETAEKYHSACSAVSAWVVRPGTSLFMASLATEALLFPVGALVFSRVTFAGIALNFLAIPLMAVAQVAGMAVVPLALFSRGAASALGWIAYIGAAGLVRSADLVHIAPAVTYRIAPPALVAVALYYVAAGAAWWSRRGADASTALRRWFSRGSVGTAVTAALWILVDPLSLVAARGDGRLHVTFIDVGQGDSAFVRFPAGSTLLVDAGGLSFSSAFDIGDRVVAPVLRQAGCYRLGVLALTHGDPDHVGGAPSIADEFRPREVWEGIPVPRSVPLTALRVDAQQLGARWANVYAGDRTVIDGVDLVAHHPRRAEWERQKVRNDDSLVLELRWRGVSVVLTGDIGRAVEPDIAAALAPASLRIVKVAHHGSRTSSSEAFIAAARPQVAIVSVGRGNHFGHPAPEVMERYRSVGAEIFRTDQDGAVMLDTDGASVMVSTFNGRHISLTSNATTKARRLEQGQGSDAQDSHAALR